MSVKINYGRPARHPQHNDRERDRSKISIDWDQITERYHARIREEIDRGLEPPEAEFLPENRDEYQPAKEHRPAKGKRSSTSTSTGRGRGWSRRYDHDEFVRLYVEQNWSGNDIARKFGCNPATVYLVLKNRGVTREYNGGINDHIKRSRSESEQEASLDSAHG